MSPRMRYSLCVTLALLTLGCESSGTRIIAAEGGRVVSDDGTLTLFFPPGSLPEDTNVSIRAIEESAWPVAAPGRFERIGDVYRVQPELILASDAYAILEVPTVPAILQTDAGEDVFAVHYLHDGEFVQPAPATRTVYLADGSVAIIATIQDLGVHWIGERIPGADLVQLGARFTADTGAHDAGLEWRWTQGSIRSDLPLDILRRTVRASVNTSGSPAIIPIADDGVVRTWDATWDAEFGLHPFEALGRASGDEAVVSFEDPIPATVNSLSPIDPLRDPLPGWTCSGTGSAGGTLFAGVDVVTGASAGVMTAGVIREFGEASCR